MPTLADRDGEEQVNSHAAGTSRVGLDLRAARERLGWTLAAIAGHLRIRLPFLEAIEEGRIADLPGNAYAVGFVRTYAQSLGLDPDEIARRFRAEAAEVNRKTDLAFPAPVPERGVPALAVVLVAAVIAIGGYVAWLRISGDQRPAHDVVQQVPERLVPLVTTRPEIADTPMPGAPQLPASSPQSPTMAQVTPPLASPATSPATSPAASPATATAPATGSAEPVPMPPRADGGRLSVHARSNLYLEVRDSTGSIVYHHRFMRDETANLPPPAPGRTLTMATEDAGGTELMVDGLAAPSLGPDHKFRRDLPLDPDAIRAGRLAASTLVPPPPRTPAHQNQ